MSYSSSRDVPSGNSCSFTWCSLFWTLKSSKVLGFSWFGRVQIKWREIFESLKKQTNKKMFPSGLPSMKLLQTLLLHVAIHQVLPLFFLLLFNQLSLKVHQRSPAAGYLSLSPFLFSSLKTFSHQRLWQGPHGLWDHCQSQLSTLSTVIVWHPQVTQASLLGLVSGWRRL